MTFWLVIKRTGALPYAAVHVVAVASNQTYADVVVNRKCYSLKLFLPIALFLWL